MKKRSLYLGVAIVLCVAVCLLLTTLSDHFAGKNAETIESTQSSESLQVAETQEREMETVAVEPEETAVNEPATEETVAETVLESSDKKVEKRLVQINEYRKDELESRYLCYDEETGLLERVIMPDNEVEAEDGGIVNLDYVYEYDDQNRLVKVQCGDVDKEALTAYYLELIYDENGRLIKYYQYYPMLGHCEINCIYDEQGVLIQTFEKMFDMTVFKKSDFTYDESGLLLEAVDKEFWPSYDDYKESDSYNDENYEVVYTTEYQYDRLNRLSNIKMFFSEDPYSERFLYAYDPIVIGKFEDENLCYYDLGYLSGMHVHVLHGMYGLYSGAYSPVIMSMSSNGKLELDEDGYVKAVKLKLEDGSYRNELEYIWETIETDG